MHSLVSNFSELADDSLYVILRIRHKPYINNLGYVTKELLTLKKNPKFRFKNKAVSSCKITAWEMTSTLSLPNVSDITSNVNGFCLSLRGSLRAGACDPADMPVSPWHSRVSLKGSFVLDISRGRSRLSLGCEVDWVSFGFS